MIADATIVNADVNASAAIAGTKINPDFGSQNISTTGNATVGGTLAITGVTTLTAQPVLSSLSVSLPVFTNGSKGLVSNPITGTGSVVLDASPVLTGTPTAPTATAGTNTTQLATTAFVTNEVTALNTLADGTIYLGNASNVATEVTLTGDVTIDNAGVSTIGASKVVSSMITDATIVNADVNASAAIAGTKIAPDFGSQNISTTGNATVGGTLAITGVTTLTAQPVLSSLSVSLPVFTNGSKGLVSNPITGTGSVVLSDSPALIGTPTAPTAALGTSTTQLATTAFVSTALNSNKIVRVNDADYTVLADDYTILYYLTANRTLTLPLADANNVGRIYLIRNVVANTSLTITFSQPIYESETNPAITSMNQNKTIKIQSYGLKWYVIE
jgi:uncharacterized membrane protein YvlD (DUF360 family)